MSDPFTKTERALLQALQRERVILKQREWVNGIILHELANAVTVVSSGAELLEIAQPGSHTYRMAQAQIGRGSGTLRQLLAGLHVLTDNSGTSPAYERLDIVSSVREMLGDHSLLGSQVDNRIDLRLRTSDPHWTVCLQLLRHAFGNLVRNALRYSTPGTPVRVTIGGRGQRWWIHIFNTGTPIPANLRDKLFEPGRKHGKGGMGLGLYIAQTCAERMGARLVYGSNSKGTNFSLVLEVIPKDASLASA